MCLPLELIRERFEDWRLFARGVRDRLREHPVGEPWVAGEQRSVEVRADGTVDSAAFGAARAVVAESGHDATERLGVQALARDLAERFALEWEFIEVENPV
ncbi:MAG TPA: hypothetical protein VJ645_00100 [Gaiellaceae bacterium]|nr:hypothetical protein [Gaiellaceae bacterium]